MLEAIEVSKRFGEKTVIDSFSMRFEAGAHYLLTGPSGSGKTTLLMLLMGLSKPSSGSVRGLGTLKLSAVFQEDRLLESLCAVSNVSFVSQASKEAVEACLFSLGLGKEDLQKPVSAFSGGMKRRVALCRALMADFDILFLDEPYKGLDEETKQRVLQVVAQRTEGKTVLLVTHDAEEGKGYRPFCL